ncbi:hypothetical protein INT46_003321 [Mucor plumbeus]|uniref:Uncharacterized protein n=1 Tax=Mucor plumbeus TaxID=97098 RepID=A0A8H7R397_9FUNG|nr:hypothetical protein INT46_003321 [Mucor plumbeus]
MFWGCISGDGPGYGTAIIDGTIDSNEYVEILKTTLMQALEYYGKQVKVFVFIKTDFLYPKSLIAPPQNPDLNPIEHIRVTLKAILILIEIDRLQNSMPKRIEAVKKSRGGTA